MADFLTNLAEYRDFFIAGVLLLMLAIAAILVWAVGKKAWEIYKESQQVETKATLRNKDYSKVNEERRANVIRRIIAPDGVDPNPNSYIVISDGGRDVFARSLTLSRLPKRTRFAYTFAPLLDFPGCTSSIFIEPVSETDMSRKLDRQINILESEGIAAEGNTNRVRKLESQFWETSKWAKQVENGEDSFYNAGFLFTLYADTLEELNKSSDSFRSIALTRGADVSNCFGVQSEAYLSNMPFNRKASMRSKIIDSGAVKMHLMNKKSLSTVFNYTSSSFTHKKGIPLGRNMFTQEPFMFDIYDPSHDGYSLLIFGKTGSGKSATIKMVVERTALQGYRFVAVDSQTRKGTSEGEYASLAEILGGVSYQISSKSGNILNIFDVQESIVYIKESASSGHEKRTLDLNSKIADCVNTLRTMMQGSQSAKKEAHNMDAALDTDIDNILTNATKIIYDRKGIVHEDADSLYEEGNIIENGYLQSGIVPKKLPTMTELYCQVLLDKSKNKDTSMNVAYKMILNSLKEYVRELYYSQNSILFFTKAEDESLQDDLQKGYGKVFVNEEDDYEEVVAIKGIRPYYDGQSTIAISKSCVFTNIDISQLTDNERVVARQIAIDFMKEQFIIKNSENINSSDRLAVIIDEAHENFEYSYARKTLANASRTARKRNVSLIYSTQTVKEYDRYPETQDILKQAAVKMVFKQDYQDREYLIKTLNLTPSQVDFITSGLGVAEAEDVNAKNQHRGEVCIIDGSQIIFCKVDYLRKTESISVETNASEVIRLIRSVS